MRCSGGGSNAFLGNKFFYFLERFYICHTYVWGLCIAIYDMTLISTDIFVTHIKDIPDITISFAEI